MPALFSQDKAVLLMRRSPESIYRLTAPMLLTGGEYMLGAPREHSPRRPGVTRRRLRAEDNNRWRTVAVSYAPERDLAHALAFKISGCLYTRTLDAVTGQRVGIVDDAFAIHYLPDAWLLENFHGTIYETLHNPASLVLLNDQVMRRVGYAVDTPRTFWQKIRARGWRIRLWKKLTRNLTQLLSRSWPMARYIALERYIHAQAEGLNDIKAIARSDYRQFLRVRLSPPRPRLTAAELADTLRGTLGVGASGGSGNDARPAPIPVFDPARSNYHFSLVDETPGEGPFFTSFASAVSSTFVTRSRSEPSFPAFIRDTVIGRIRTDSPNVLPAPEPEPEPPADVAAYKRRSRRLRSEAEGGSPDSPAA